MLLFNSRVGVSNLWVYEQDLMKGRRVSSDSVWTVNRGNVKVTRLGETCVRQKGLVLFGLNVNPFSLQSSLASGIWPSAFYPEDPASTEVDRLERVSRMTHMAGVEWDRPELSKCPGRGTLPVVYSSLRVSEIHISCFCPGSRGI